MTALGIKLIKHFEGCKLKAYQDSVGVWTIGFGHTEGAKQGLIWTQEQADKQLMLDLDNFEVLVKKLLKKQLDENQISALVSFAYNLGIANLKRSTLLNCVNKGNFKVSTEFARWDKAGGKVLPGLTKRRAAEAMLFDDNLTGVEKALA